MSGRDELMALVPVLQNLLTVTTPERVTRLERIVCALIQTCGPNEIRGPRLVELARLIEQAMDAKPDADFSEVPDPRGSVPKSLRPEIHIRRIEIAIDHYNRSEIGFPHTVAEVNDAIGCLRKSLKDRGL